jgi:hypothetical protein
MGKAYKCSVGTGEWHRPCGVPSINGRIILKQILRRGCESVDWLKVPQEGVHKQDRVNTATKLRIPLEEKQYFHEEP